MAWRGLICAEVFMLGFSYAIDIGVVLCSVESDVCDTVVCAFFCDVDVSVQSGHGEYAIVGGDER